MMRRGPLDRYPPEWVLRQANAHNVGGSIEFHTDRPVTFYLDGGRIYAGAEGVDLADHDVGGHAIPDEDDARDRVVSLLAGVLAAGGGWYFHEPLGQHPGRGAWTWETATLLMETRAKAHEVTTLAEWADRTVALGDTPASSVTLGADAWAIVVALAGSASASELRTRLGWSPHRMLGALTEIEQRGVLDPDAERSRSDAPTDTFSMAFESVGAPIGGHHTGPLAPPPPPPSDPPSSRRRMLPTRRSSSS